MHPFINHFPYFDSAKTMKFEIKIVFMATRHTNITISFVSIGVMKPTLMAMPHEDPVINSSVLLSCSSNGNPSPVYKWFKDGSQMVDKTLNVLFIQSISLKDSGDYYCIASNAFNQSDIIHLSVWGKY